jgi:hypothetical protein
MSTAILISNTIVPAVAMPISPSGVWIVQDRPDRPVYGFPRSGRRCHPGGCTHLLSLGRKPQPVTSRKIPLREIDVASPFSSPSELVGGQRTDKLARQPLQQTIGTFSPTRTRTLGRSAHINRPMMISRQRPRITTAQPTGTVDIEKSVGPTSDTGLATLARLIFFKPRPLLLVLLTPRNFAPHCQLLVASRRLARVKLLGLAGLIVVFCHVCLWFQQAWPIGPYAPRLFGEEFVTLRDEQHISHRLWTSHCGAISIASPSSSRRRAAHLAASAASCSASAVMVPLPQPAPKFPRPKSSPRQKHSSAVGCSKYLEWLQVFVSCTPDCRRTVTAARNMQLGHRAARFGPSGFLPSAPCRFSSPLMIPTTASKLYAVAVARRALPAQQGSVPHGKRQQEG